MLFKNDYPILEFDDNRMAVLDPENFKDRKFDTDKLVITFFPEVMERLIERGEIEKTQVIPGENPITLYRFCDTPDVMLTLGQLGCPACAGNMDLLRALGTRRVMFCGGGGVLDRSIEVGTVMVVEGAIRDEGFSYHYLPPSRIVYADKETNAKITRYLDAHGVPYFQGFTWTTDAIFRETPDRVARRREEGAKIVEMEQAGCLAVAQFRKMTYGALIYGGDDVSGEEWSDRGWRSRDGIRYDLVQLCKALVSEI